MCITQTLIRKKAIDNLFNIMDKGFLKASATLCCCSRGTYFLLVFTSFYLASIIS